MIVIVSDLHLQHTRHDVVRRREGERILETRISRNVSAGALGLLFTEILENSDRCQAREVHLVFAGDIFEIHRTPLWFLWNDSVRPVQSPPGEELEAKVHQILGHIEEDNSEFFAALRRFVSSGVVVYRGEEKRLEHTKIHTHYIPGNHDRLVQLWPSTRARVRKLLALEGDVGSPFPHFIDWDRSAGYGVRIRHGHEYDRYNFGAEFDPEAPPPPSEDYEQPTLGDYVTVDVATRLAVAFRAHFARELRSSGANGDCFRRVYAALTEFDDVRPQRMLPQYLSNTVGMTQGDTFAMLRPVLRDVYDTATADSFFVSEAEKVGLGHYFRGPLAKMFRLALENLDGDAMVAAIEHIGPLSEAKASKGPAASARRELGLESGAFSLVIAGHTHEADHVALPIPRLPGGPSEAYFLDTGTWRTRLDAGEGGAFGRLRGYTMVFCYHDGELRQDEQRRFETWTGHLQAEDYGARLSVDVTDSVPPAPRQRVRFVQVEIQHVDEAETKDGAELRLHFGVDGIGSSVRFDGVHDGDVLDLPEDACVIEVDPALDGEVWCFGVEEDLGPTSLLDRDDPVPWAVTFLRREGHEASAPFTPGSAKLRAADNRGNAFTLRFEISSAPREADPVTQ